MNSIYFRYILWLYFTFADNPNDKYHGYLKDLLDELAKIIDFQYTLSQAIDGRFGHRLPSGEWNGLVGELQRKVS